MDHQVAHEQLCYIPCNFCSIVLAVSVPYTSLFDVVTVRCGHCSNLWSVNMGAAFQSLQQQQPSATQTTTPAALNKNIHVQGASNPVRQYKADTGSSSKWNKAAQQYSTTNKTHDQRIVDRPPEKRQRVPSAYNQFIKEEIQRIKANNPDISHREAFSTAAKNWAHFPHIHFGLMLETNNRA